MDDFKTLSRERRWLLFQAAGDFFALQNRSYPRRASLELVGNRYALDTFERMILHRGMFGQKEAFSRRAKRVRGCDWQRKSLVVDGHNVQITVESSILGAPLIRANDGALRDLAGRSFRFKPSEATNLAMDLIFRFFESLRPLEVLFLFDAPMSHSGELASRYRARLRTCAIPGDAQAVPVPEREFPYETCVAASSDGAVLDASSRWVDLACLVIDRSGLPEITADFSRVLHGRSARAQLFSDGGPY